MKTAWPMRVRSLRVPRVCVLASVLLGAACASERNDSPLDADVADAALDTTESDAADGSVVHDTPMPPDASGDTSDAAEDPGDAADNGEVDTSRPDQQTAQQWCEVFRSAGRPEGMCPDGQCTPPREGCLADVRFVAGAYAAAVHVSPGAGASLPHSWAIPDLPEDEGHRWGQLDSEHFACLDAGVLVVDASTCEVALQSVAGEALWTLDVGAIDREVLDGTGPDAGTRVTVTSQSARVDADASILGCGENTGPLDRRGTRVQYFNTDAYNSDYGGWAPDAPLLYASIPFCTFLSDDAAWGLFVDAPERTEIDLGRTTPGQVVVRSHGQPVFWLLPATAPGGVLRAYHRLTGAPALVPRWALGFHQSRWGYQTADDVLAVARGFRERNLPLDTMWLDIQHMDGFRTFTFDPVRFPNPAGLIADLDRIGVSTVVIADPGIKVDASWPLWRVGQQDRLYLQNPDGTDGCPLRRPRGIWRLTRCNSMWSRPSSELR